MDGLYWKNPIKMDDLGVPLFSETAVYLCCKYKIGFKGLMPMIILGLDS